MNINTGLLPWFCSILICSTSNNTSTPTPTIMAEKITTQPTAAKPFFLHPTQDFDANDIKKGIMDGIDNLKTDGSGLSGVNGPPQEFETGLFDCFAHIPTCLLSWCCGPCLFHRTYHVLNRQPDQFPEDEFVGGTCLSFCGVSCITGIGGCVWATLRRGAIREKYNLKGSTRMDAALTCCCAPCTIAQEDIEVRKREKRDYDAFKNSQQSVAAQQL